MPAGVADPPRRRTTYAEVLSVGAFRGLFVARTLAILGIGVRMLALSVLVLTVTGSPLLAGVAYGIGFLPQVVGGFTLLSLADRLPARRLVVGGFALETLVGLAIVLPGLPPWALLVPVALLATVSPVFAAAGTGMLADLLEGDRYVLGRSLLNMSSALAQIVGLAAAGAVIAVLGTRPALLVAAGLSLAAAAVAGLMLPAVPARARSDGRGTLRTTWDGNRALLGDAAVRGQIILQMLPAAFATGAEGVVVAYVAAEHLPRAAGGLLLSCVPVGMLAGDLLVGRFCVPAVRERLSRWLLLLTGVPLGLFLLHPGTWTAALLLALSGSGSAYLLGMQRRFLEVLPTGMRGQGFGLLGTALMSGQGVGPIVLGAVATVRSPAVAIAVGGACVVACALRFWALLGPEAGVTA